MGLLQKGKWVDQWYDTGNSGGEFRRQDSRFRSWLTPDGNAGPNGEPGFKAEKGRYHLYVSLACPWAHRALIFRQIKQLQDYIDVTVVDPVMLENGWEMNDPLYGLDFLYQLYLKADSSYEGRVTVPVLWDKQTQTIVSNESSEIIRMLNTAFNALTGNTIDYYPDTLHERINALNDRVYDTINNGVYRAGFATTQEAYEKAYHSLFDSLDWVEGLLDRQRYLGGGQLTEADWRLFTTLIRFDAVYFGHFKTNRQLLADYPAISGYVRELYQIPGVSDTVSFEHIKTHYYASHLMINPTGIIPVGPAQDFTAAHGREGIGENS
ncbi:MULTISPECIES: glutathione S-transferase family protein [unclassified Marinobacter]|uniref:glutathione S-transferase family protein n=1 Tax=unclassified Marinobacter TaxID=83889 RepID=UPI000BF2B100|nr:MULTISPECIES: glutathione S-transferase family protein [unclassified Marinobacter]PFG08174.1 putative glutathione S-transferase [Marinobacter sp. LV10MA510-1]PFG53991.1 putative glutathione S-transferase [Marinobacter sp. LV10R520-4]